MNRTKAIGSGLTVALVLAALITLTIGVADHTDEGLLNEQQEQIGVIDLESDGADSGSQHTVEHHRAATSTSRMVAAT